MNVTNTSNPDPSSTLRGWVSQPNGRGTFDLLVSCAVTVFLCGWSSICVNVPAPDQSKWNIFWDKWHMFCLSMLGPEFVFMLALGQHTSAAGSVKLYHEKGFTDWTMKRKLSCAPRSVPAETECFVTKAAPSVLSSLLPPDCPGTGSNVYADGFFADMGGFFLQPRGWKSFPINSKQLLYLIKCGHLRYPKTSVAQINDRNKSDDLARYVKLERAPKSGSLTYQELLRFVTSIQIIWFTVNIIARPTQKLAVTTIEITTIASIVCTLGVSFCWRHKPMDVGTAIVLETDHTMQKILEDAGDLYSEPYRMTPLDFVSREEWAGTKLWTYNVNILRKLHVVHQNPKVRPIQHLSSINFPKIQRRGGVMTVVMALAYSGILMIAWNFEFPTPTERLMWRICTSLTMGLTILMGIIEVALPEPSTPHNRKDEETPLDTTQRTRKAPSVPNLFQRITNKRFNNSPGGDRALDVPIKTMLLSQPICAIYTLCRIYVLLEDLIGLRALPATVFQNVDWTVYIPHI